MGWNFFTQLEGKDWINLATESNRSG